MGRLLSLLSLFALIPCMTVSVQADWTDVTGPTGVASNGAAWGDYDNDGDLDLYVSGSGANRLFQNVGTDTFVDATTGPLGDTEDGRGVAWADFDNDGDLDLYLGNNNSANRLFRNDRGGTFVDVASGPLADTGPAWGVAWGDYNRDGLVDLALANNAQDLRVFRNDGGGVFSNPLNLGECTWMMPGWVDYDNDGDPDLYATCFHDQSRLFRNDSGNFVDLTPAAVTPTGLGQGWGDYDNDGDLDLYLARWGTANQLVRNDGGGVFVDVTTGPLGSTENAGAAIWGDYDKDGDLDLYVANGTGGLLIRNDNVTGNHWLQVDLRGILSNAAGIGARVKVTAGGKIMIREVSGGASYQGQPALRAEFGLGPITNVTVKILWPSGIEQTLSGIAADQCVTVVEDIAIPVQLLEFSATRVGDIAEVHWRIAELGEDPVFQVFRQSQGGDRERISDEPMSGSLDYRFVDRSPPPGRVAYWLHEMSRSGRIGPRPGVRRSRTLGGDAPG